jgi:S1-C subfamily serine protease
VAALILAAGWLLRPRDVAQSPPAVPSESELQELARRTQRRALESMAGYFADLAATVRASVAYVPSAGTSGVAWDETRIVAGPIASPSYTGTIVARTGAGERRVAAITSRRLPLSILTVAPDPPKAIARRAASLPQPGEWMLAVWQTDRGPAFAAGNFRQVATTACGAAEVHEVVSTVPLSRAMVGGALFNMDRELVGIILPCSDHIAAVEASDVDELMRRAATIEELLLARYGVLFDTPSEDERRYFSDVAGGLLVREVWTGTKADAAGIRAGDLLVSLDEHEVTGADDLRALVTRSDAPFGLRLRRGSSTETVVLDGSGSPDLSSEGGTGLGLFIEPASPAFRIDRVAPESPAARAGVRPGDELLRINHVEPRTRAQVERALKRSTAGPTLLEIARGARRIAILIPEAAPR